MLISVCIARMISDRHHDERVVKQMMDDQCPWNHSVRRRTVVHTRLERYLTYPSFVSSVPNLRYSLRVIAVLQTSSASFPLLDGTLSHLVLERMISSDALVFISIRLTVLISSHLILSSPAIHA